MSEERKPIRAAVMTMSDLGARGEREDTSGDRIVEFVAALGADLVERVMIPDEREQIRQNLMRFADDMELDLVLTTGGTGIAPRDVTPDATASVVDYQVPGIAEAMRVMSVPPRTPTTWRDSMPYGVFCTLMTRIASAMPGT